MPFYLNIFCRRHDAGVQSSQQHETGGEKEHLRTVWQQNEKALQRQYTNKDVCAQSLDMQCWRSFLTFPFQEEIEDSILISDLVKAGNGDDTVAGAVISLVTFSTL